MDEAFFADVVPRMTAAGSMPGRRPAYDVIACTVADERQGAERV
jgi:hypothetical protein